MAERNRRLHPVGDRIRSALGSALSGDRQAPNLGGELERHLVPALCICRH